MAALELCCRRASSCTMIVSTLLLSIHRDWNIDLNRAECFTEAFSVFSRPWHSSQSDFQTLLLCALHKHYKYYTLLMMFVMQILCSDFFTFSFCTVTTFNIILLFFLRSTFTVSLVDCSVLHNFYNPYLFCMVLHIKNTQQSLKTKWHLICAQLD